MATLNPVFADILDAHQRIPQAISSATSGECPECHIRLSVAASGGHLRGCSKYVPLKPIQWGKDGFVRNERGHIEGFAEGNEVKK